MMTISAASRESAPFFRTNWRWLVLILALVTVCWCFTYHRWTIDDWSVPLVYDGDGWSGLAGAKGLATGEIWPFLPKHPRSLGAPFIANWNDYPIVEEGLLAWWTIFVRLFGVFFGTNITILSASLLAAVSFYFVCWQLNYSRIFAAVGAILFALSRYAFARGFGHIVLTFYWHVPLGLLVAWWCLSDAPLVAQRRKLIFALIVAVLHGIQNPYYTWFFAQLLGFAALYQLIRHKKARFVISPLLVAAVAGGTFLLANVDTFYFRWANGPPPSVSVIRDYAGLENYALKPIELFIPPVHNIRAVESWALGAYFQRALVRGEFGAAYLGIVGIFSFALLLSAVARSITGAHLRAIPCHFWGLAIIFAYAVIGGLNGVIGMFGIVLFRCSNRFSIAILAIVLLFLVRQLSEKARHWRTHTIVLSAFALLAIGVFDQLPPHTRARTISALRAQLSADSKMVAELERTLPPGAMVFELPVMGFPEVPPIRGVADYEQFRPYFYSHQLRFSYGSDKGRYRDNWRHEMEQLGVSGMVQRLEAYGFSALLLYRDGYEAAGEPLLAELRKANKTEILSQTSDIVAIALSPSQRPIMPPEFGQGWHGLEGNAVHNWRWAAGDANITLHNPRTDVIPVQLTFKLVTLASRYLSIEGPTGRMYGASLAGGADSEVLKFVVPLSPGKNELRFRTDSPGQLPGTGDQRKLAFALHDFEISGL
jgi:hypothetical protein